MNFNDIKWSSVLDGLSTVATVFNPQIGVGLRVASQVANNISEDDDLLENSVIGLIRTAENIDEIVNNITLIDKERNERLLLLSNNLRDLAEIDRKHNLMMR